jgi:hypothetical protein
MYALADFYSSSFAPGFISPPQVGLFEEKLTGDFIIFFIKCSPSDEYADGHKMN